MNRTPANLDTPDALDGIRPTPAPEHHRDEGFTLIEILIAIVLVGILSAVAVVAISNLVDRGSDSACEASKDAAVAASAVYFASNNNTYPSNFTELTGGDSPALALASGVEVGDPPTTLRSGSNWTLTMTPGQGPGAPSFECD